MTQPDYDPPSEPHSIVSARELHTGDVVFFHELYLLVVSEAREVQSREHGLLIKYDTKRNGEPGGLFLKPDASIYRIDPTTVKL